MPRRAAVAQQRVRLVENEKGARGRPPPRTPRRSPSPNSPSIHRAQVGIALLEHLEAELARRDGGRRPTCPSPADRTGRTTAPSIGASRTCSASSARSTSAELSAGSKAIGAGARRDLAPAHRPEAAVEDLAAPRSPTPRIRAAERMAFSISAGARRQTRELQRGVRVEPEASARPAIRATIVLRADEPRLGEAHDEVHAPHHRRTEPVDVVGDPDRRRARRARRSRFMNTLLPLAGRGVVLVDAGEQIVGLVDRDDHLSAPSPPMRVGDHAARRCARAGWARRSSAVVLADEMDGEAETRAPSVLTNSLFPVPGGP